MTISGVSRREESKLEFGEFTEAYFVLLTRAWISEEYVAELLADPSPALREAGFEVPPGIDVEVIRHSDGEADLEWQYQMWLEGIAAGSARLYLPEPEPVHFGELLETELEAMPGGATYCCSCCPCCTCTA